MMFYLKGFTRRAPKEGHQAIQHAHSGKFRDKKQTTAMALCGAPLVPANGRSTPSELVNFYGAMAFEPDAKNACRRCRWTIDN